MFGGSNVSRPSGVGVGVGFAVRVAGGLATGALSQRKLT